ncbi:MAG: hypothetical protein MR433_03760 [Coriobacteriaceae bacterium]|nr:hypothetical protein [Coriobacteriaceae bacterium]MDY5809191.1 hypothetical protein [Coriobacteriales bacterium]
MMWKYIALADDTQIAYSETQKDGTVIVTAERPVDMGFDFARCLLPSYQWSDTTGFSDDEMCELDAIVRDNAPLIIELADQRADEKTKAA